MIRGNTSDFIDHPLPTDYVSAHGVSHHAWAPGPPPMGVHRNFSRGGQRRHFPYLFQFVGDATQMDVNTNVECYGNSYIQCLSYKNILH